MRFNRFSFTIAGLVLAGMITATAPAHQASKAGVGQGAGESAGAWATEHRGSTGNT